MKKTPLLLALFLLPALAWSGEIQTHVKKKKPKNTPDAPAAAVASSSNKSGGGGGAGSLGSRTTLGGSKAGSTSGSAGGISPTPIQSFSDGTKPLGCRKGSHLVGKKCVADAPPAASPPSASNAGGASPSAGQH